ncbi:hypothetical protein ACFOY8_14305 [Thalassospira xianhensis]|uniref:Uncharacterized protein n=1 Tax=Thalassospira xianhensis MCCC 1A02616 TaxID=1177929 RepID=A0A367UK15_9PROT|nr:hypothetical protein [Thalassospira xianhensis]RCK07674.1 hypothetical protein TH5_00960 [Thalassospira xianhensis MCCC 1A02616]
MDPGIHSQFLSDLLQDMPEQERRFLAFSFFAGALEEKFGITHYGEILALLDEMAEGNALQRGFLVHEGDEEYEVEVTDVLDAIKSGELTHPCTGQTLNIRDPRVECYWFVPEIQKRT